MARRFCSVSAVQEPDKDPHEGSTRLGGSWNRSEDGGSHRPCPTPRVGIANRRRVDAGSLGRAACQRRKRRRRGFACLSKHSGILSQLAPRDALVLNALYGKRRTTGMKKGMKESYIEDLANHGGPEPCVGDPRGRSEALDRGARRPAIEPRNAFDRGADAIVDDGRQHRWRRFREPSAGPAGSENPLHACDLFMPRTGRSHGHPCPSKMPRPIWIAGWHNGGWRVVRGRPRP